MTKQLIDEDRFDIIDRREKYFKVSNNIFSEDLDIYEIGIYSVLCRFANNDTSESFPSITRICNMVKISRPKAISTIKKLVSKNIILKKQGNTGYSNRYYLKSLPSKQETLVNDINQPSKQDLPPSKPRLPEVVNEVNSKKTNKKDLIKKTNYKANSFKKQIIKPTIQEIQSYIQEKKYTSIDANYFYDFYDSNDWKDTYGKQVSNWKQKLIQWFNREKKNTNSTPYKQPNQNYQTTDSQEMKDKCARAKGEKQ